MQQASAPPPTRVQRKQWQQQNRCIWCGGADHLRRNCPDYLQHHASRQQQCSSSSRSPSSGGGQRSSRSPSRSPSRSRSHSRSRSRSPDHAEGRTTAQQQLFGVAMDAAGGANGQAAASPSVQQAAQDWLEDLASLIPSEPHKQGERVSYPASYLQRHFALPACVLQYYGSFAGFVNCTPQLSWIQAEGNERMVGFASYEAHEALCRSGIDALNGVLPAQNV